MLPPLKLAAVGEDVCEAGAVIGGAPPFDILKADRHSVISLGNSCEYSAAACVGELGSTVPLTHACPSSASP
jgi:hypothetical protein